MPDSGSRVHAFLTHEIVVKVAIPLIAPLIAIGALYYAISSGTAEIRRELSYERESKMQSIVGISVFAESLMNPIFKSYWADGIDRGDLVRADEATVLLYKRTIEKLCDKISSEHSINHLYYSRIEFVSGSVTISTPDYLAQNCVRSKEIGFPPSRTVGGEEMSIGDGVTQSNGRFTSNVIDPREVQDVTELYLFLKTVMYFFEDDDCIRRDLYSDMEGLAEQAESAGYMRGAVTEAHLVSRGSTAYADIVECSRPVVSAGWRRSVVGFSNAVSLE